MMIVTITTVIKNHNRNSNSNNSNNKWSRKGRFRGSVMCCGLGLGRQKWVLNMGIVAVSRSDHPVGR